MTSLHRAALLISTIFAVIVGGWAFATFGVLHFGYHAAHLAEMTVTDAVGNVLTLGLSLLLGIVLLVPAGRISSAEEAVK